MFLTLLGIAVKSLALSLGQLAQGLARFLHTEEVTGSNPVLPIQQSLRYIQKNTQSPSKAGFFVAIIPEKTK